MGAVAQSCREDDVGVARWSSMWGSAVKYSRRRCEVADVVFGVWKMGKRTGWCSRGRYGEADVVFGAVWTEDMNVSQSVYIRTRRSVRLAKAHTLNVLNARCTQHRGDSATTVPSAVLRCIYTHAVGGYFTHHVTGYFPATSHDGLGTHPTSPHLTSPHPTALRKH